MTPTGSGPALGPTRTSLLDVDPDLGRDLTDEARSDAASALTVSLMVLEPGAWAAPANAPRGAELGLLVQHGALMRELRVAGGRASELLGAGDLIRPWQEEAASFAGSGWEVLQPTSVAVLELRLLTPLARWPQVATRLLERAVRRSRWLVVQAAISHVVGVEKRVLLTLWHIAEKWGQVEDGGVRITVSLTHQVLGQMTGASRSYVTQAVGALAERGEIERRADGQYVLLGDPPRVPSGAT